MMPARIKELRRKADISQEQLAERLQVSQGAVSQWETGRSIPDIHQLLAMANIFDVSVDYLLGKDQQEETPYRPLERLRELRISEGMSQEEFGELFQAAQNTVSQWETGLRDMPTSTLLAISRYFGVTTDYLLSKDASLLHCDSGSVPKRIEEVMKQRNLSQNKLASKAGISQSAISVIISGEKSPRIDTLQRIARSLKVSVAFLVGESTSTEPPAYRGAIMDAACDLSEGEEQRVLDFIAGIKAARK